MEVDIFAAAAAAKLIQSCLTLCNPTDSSPPGSPVPGILQSRTLECVAISFSNAWEWKVKVKSLSRVRLLATSWTAAPRLLHPWIFQARVLEWGALPSLLVYLKTGKVIKTTESLRNSHSQEEPKKIQQLNAMWCPQWNPDIGKGHWVNTKEIWINDGL